MSRKSKAKVRGRQAVAAVPTPESSTSSTLPNDGDHLPVDNRRRKMVVVGICLLLVASVLLVFGRTLHYGFVNYDDEEYVSKNWHVNRGVTLTGIAWSFTHAYSSNWHPLTWISHMLDCQMYGVNANGHHLTSVLLHATTTVLLFLLLMQMTGRMWRSAFVAAVFAIHPLRVESVAWVAERKDVLSGVFFVLTLGAYVRYARKPFSYGRYLAVTVALALGLMCKPTLVTLPFVLLLLDYWPLQRLGTGGQNFRRLVLEKLPWLGLCTAACVVTLFAQNDAMKETFEMPFGLRVGNALIAYVAYLGQMFWPQNLVVFYMHPGTRFVAWNAALALMLLLVISVAVVHWRRTRPWLLIGWLWYLGMLVPMIGIVQVGMQSRADRYTYLSQIGLYIAVTWTAAELCSRWRRGPRMLGGAAVIVLAVLMVSAHAQTVFWRNSDILWTHAVAATSDNPVAQDNLAQLYLNEGKVDEAIPLLETAVEISPRYVAANNNLGKAYLKKDRLADAMAQFDRVLTLNTNYAPAYDGLGLVAAQKGRMDEAIHLWQKSIEIKPDFADAHNNLGLAYLRRGQIDDAFLECNRAAELNPDYPDAHNNLGLILVRKGRLEEGIAQFQQAIALNPDYADAHNNLGLVLRQTGRMEEAVAHFKKVVEINPNSPNAHTTFGLSLAQTGRPAEAITQFKQAIAINPKAITARNTLAWLLATSPNDSLRDGAEAVTQAEQASRLAGGKSPEILSTLAAAYAEAGNFSNAVAAANQALSLATAQTNQPVVEKLREELARYQSGSPWREVSAVPQNR